LEALLEAAQHLLQIELLDGPPLLLAERAHPDRVLEPVEELLGDLLGLHVDATEVGGEGHVEVVEVGLGVNEQGAGHVVEAGERRLVEPLRDRRGKRPRLLRAHRDLALAELVEELDEHGYDRYFLPPASWSASVAMSCSFFKSAPRNGSSFSSLTSA